MSSAPQTFVRAASDRASATTSSCVAPFAASRAACETTSPSPSVHCSLSTTVTFTVSATDRAASSADCMVAERPPLRLIATMLVAPSSAKRR